MRPLKRARHSSTIEREPRAHKTPSLKLKGVIVGGSNSVASINGKLLRLGERIDGYQIVRIEEKRVFLRSGNRTFKLELAKK
jgi:type II secretory pathway component PulC